MTSIRTRRLTSGDRELARELFALMANPHWVKIPLEGIRELMDMTG